MILFSVLSFPRILSLLLGMFNVFLLFVPSFVFLSFSLVDNAFYNVLGINIDGERPSHAVPVTCLNFDRSPTKSLSQRLKIRYGISHHDDANDSNSNNNSGKSNPPTSGSYRAGAKVRFELERAAQKKPQFLESFQIIECTKDASTEGKNCITTEILSLHNVSSNINPN